MFVQSIHTKNKKYDHSDQFLGQLGSLLEILL